MTHSYDVNRKEVRCFYLICNHNCNICITIDVSVIFRSPAYLELCYITTIITIYIWLHNHEKIYKCGYKYLLWQQIFLTFVGCRIVQLKKQCLTQSSLKHRFAQVLFLITIHYLLSINYVLSWRNSLHERYCAVCSFPDLPTHSNEISPKEKFLQRNNRSSYNSYNFFYDAVNTIRSSITIDAYNIRCTNTYLSLPVFSQAPLQAFRII